MLVALVKNKNQEALKGYTGRALVLMLMAPDAIALKFALAKERGVLDC